MNSVMNLTSMETYDVKTDQWTEIEYNVLSVTGATSHVVGESHTAKMGLLSSLSLPYQNKVYLLKQLHSFFWYDNCCGKNPENRSLNKSHLLGIMINSCTVELLKEFNKHRIQLTS